MEGYPIQVIAAKADRSFELRNIDKLREILLDQEIKDRKVVVISVAGAFRTGKSFLLNFFLRYLHWNYKSQDQNDWLGNEDARLEGFSWAGGPQRNTVGILMWSEVFKTTVRGEKLAIILLDTQGLFDNKTTVMEWTTIFSVSTMISSAQIFNLSRNIQEDDLQNLQLFLGYARLGMSKNENIRFQDLWFLVRDWPNASFGVPYGTEGGHQFIDDILNKCQTDNLDMLQMRQQIRNSFDNISCFLLPHPGLVVTRSDFDGRHKNMQEDFKEELRKFVPLLLAPDNLVIKKVHGRPISATELLALFKSCVGYFNKEEVPKPVTPTTKKVTIPVERVDDTFRFPCNII